jgi:hypothetical protein
LAGKTIVLATKRSQTPDSLISAVQVKDNKTYKLANESRMLINELWNQIRISAEN